MVTGGSGFLGSHLVDRLQDSLVMVPRRAAWDLFDTKATFQLFRQFRPHVVFHLAAKCGGIGANQDAPAEFIVDNIVMGANVIEACHAARVEKLVLVGTVCSYPKHTPAPFREEDIWNGYPEETNAPYGVAKRALLTMAQAYRQQYGMNAIYLIPANLYGPRDNFDPQTSHVVPALIRKFLEARESGAKVVPIWGDGTATREFLYVEDCAGALIEAAEQYDGGDPVNIGNGREISIKKLAYEIAGMCGYEGRLQWDATKPNGQPRRVLDVSRAQKLFGWEATTGLEAGVRRTIAWYREHRKAMAA